MCLGLVMRFDYQDYWLRDWSFGRCGLQYLQLHFTAHFEPGFHADRQRDVRARDVSRTQTECHRNSQIANHTQDHFFERVILVWTLLAIQHLAEDNAANVLQLARKLQLHQHPVNLVRLGGDVLHEENGSLSMNVIRRAKCGDEDRKTSAIENAFRLSRPKRLL